MTAVNTDAPSDNFQHLPLHLIEPEPGFNTRTYFDPVSLAEMADSIRQAGVVQPIVVRPIPDRDGYYIVAGERRWRASKLAEKADIPAVIRTVTATEALLINAFENLQREGISTAEEAHLVRRVVDVCDGDREEAARRLGMSRRTVDARLLLLNASDAVLTALAERKIKLGIAELLCTLPAETQDGSLEKVIADNVGIDDLRQRLDAFALNLRAAIFDTSGCTGCPHNTSGQYELFEQHLGEGRCLNRQCFGEKREQRLVEMKSEHMKTFPCVFRASEKDPATYTILLKNGPDGVGPEQAQACLGCAHYGSLMSDAPGMEGQLSADMCFNVECNREKKGVYQALLMQCRGASGAAKDMTGGGPSSSPDSDVRGSGKTAAKGKAGAKAAPRKVEELHHRFYRDTAATAVQDHPLMGLAYAAFALLSDIASEARDLMKRYDLKPNHFTSEGQDKAITALAALDKEKLKALIVEAAALTVKEKVENWYGKDAPVMVKTAAATLKACGTDLSRYFRVSKEYLESHTKSGIASLLAEVAFDKWWNEQKNDNKAFPALMAMKHDEIVKTVMKSGFSFDNFVPRAVRLD